MLFGAIGYTILENSLLFPDLKIILISDKHDEDNKYCTSINGDIINSIDISEYLKKLIEKNYTILLEEIPYLGELVTLWNDSDHVMTIRKLYLDCIKDEKIKDKIFAFDIRLDLVKNMSSDYYLEKKLIDYIENIQKFFLLEYDELKELKKLKIYNSNIDKSFLGKYYYDILKKYYFFIKTYQLYLNYKIKDIPTNNEVYDTIDLLLSHIIEFYCTCLIFDLIDKTNRIVVYCGLYHTENIKKNLIKYFKFNKITDRGIVSLEDIDNITQTCSDIPIKL
jgi:hypothetical protein